MPKLIRWIGREAQWSEDAFTMVDDDQHLPPGDVIISLARFQREGRELLGVGRSVGVRLAVDDAPEDLLLDIGRLSVLALTFPKLREGRPYTAARIVRERFSYTGELRAVGAVTIDMATMLVRCGFDAFEPSDGSTPDQWTRSANRFRHVYQRTADGRPPAYSERAGA